MARQMATPESILAQIRDFSADLRDISLVGVNCLLSENIEAKNVSNSYFPLQNGSTLATAKKLRHDDTPRPSPQVRLQYDL